MKDIAHLPMISGTMFSTVGAEHRDVQAEYELTRKLRSAESTGFFPPLFNVAPTIAIFLHDPRLFSESYFFGHCYAAEISILVTKIELLMIL